MFTAPSLPQYTYPEFINQMVVQHYSTLLNYYFHKFEAISYVVPSCTWHDRESLGSLMEESCVCQW